MNKQYLIFILLTLTLSIATFAIYTHKKIHFSTTAYENEFLDNQKSIITSLIPQIRHLLITGNQREATQILNNWKNAGIYEEYRIRTLDDKHQKLISSDTIIVPIHFSKEGTKWGDVLFKINDQSISKFSKEIKDQLTINFLLTLITFFITSSFLTISIWKSSLVLFESLENHLSGYKHKLNQIYSFIWSPILIRMKKIAEISNELKMKDEQLKISQEIFKVSRQVSHDIRSPLAALNIALEDLSSLPQNKRQIVKIAIQRIQDIANNLLINAKNNEPSKNTSSFINPLIEEIISEKRIEYSNNKNIYIEESLTSSIGFCILINPTLFKQILSNLINNSVEAMNKDFLTIEIKTEIQTDKIRISIKDNGKGIPLNLIPILTTSAISIGKESSTKSGHGIALKHAVDTIKSWDGDLNIESTLDQQTTILIDLPISSEPQWFIRTLDFSNYNNVLILDDNIEIHHTWKNKLENIQIPIWYFSNTQDLLTWINNHINSNFILLTDFDLNNPNETGLDFIDKEKLHGQSILVTSHYDEIIKMRSDIKVIPKALIGFVKIKIPENV